MVKKNKMEHKKELEHACACGSRCLGPMTFDTEAVGRRVTLSQLARRASREVTSFRHGLLFTSRPVKVREKVCLRVERSMLFWHGGLRVGFTNVRPGSRPLPSLAMPDLTDTPGYCAMPVPEMACLPGSVIQFWVNKVGYLCIRGADWLKHSFRAEVDLSQPLWAMIDLYGQTNTVLLLGSERKGLFGTRRSCHLPPAPPIPEESCYVEPPKKLLEKIKQCQNSTGKLEEHQNDLLSPANDSEVTEDCVVCITRGANTSLSCGHRSLCAQCAVRVSYEFGICPLCRRGIDRVRLPQ